MDVSITGIQDVGRSIASRGLFASQNAFDLGAQAMKKTADALGEAAIKVMPAEVEAQVELEEPAEPASEEDKAEETPPAD